MGAHRLVDLLAAGLFAGRRLEEGGNLGLGLDLVAREAEVERLNQPRRLELELEVVWVWNSLLGLWMRSRWVVDPWRVERLQELALLVGIRCVALTLNWVR